MTPFLKLVADDLYQKLGGNFQDTCIIFPNKRASLFFNEYLWSNSEGKTMWTPEYTSISELFAGLSELTVGDPIYLVIKLWEVYKEKMQPTKTLDQLYSLMETMLSDFQDIDNNLVEPSKLFLNIADLKEMTDFSFLEDEQREAIEQFFGQSTHWATSDAQSETPLKSHFITLWNRLTDIYETYQKALLITEEEPMVYEGMLKRRVIEMLTGKDEEARKRADERLTAKTYVMVGFNVLNKTELELFRYIKQHRDTKFYWDYDTAYTTSHQPSTYFHPVADGECADTLHRRVDQEPTVSSQLSTLNSPMARVGRHSLQREPPATCAAQHRQGGCHQRDDGLSVGRDSHLLIGAGTHGAAGAWSHRLGCMAI